MSINWSKVEENPNKKQAVEGTFLLELRDKVKNLAQRLDQTRK